MIVAVLGGGDEARGMAAELAQAGHTVRLWTSRDQDRDLPRGTRAKLDRITADLEDGVTGADVVIVGPPAIAHTPLAGQLATVFGDQQIVLLGAGTFGSYAIAREIGRRGGRLPFAFAETGSHLTFARKAGPAGATPDHDGRLPTGVFPAARAAATLDRLRALVPAIQPCRDVLDAALTDAGPAIHAPMALLDAVAIDASPAAVDASANARRLSEVVDAERVAVRTKLGLPQPHYEIAITRGARTPADQVGTAGHRDGGEDVALGLSLIESAGRLAGADTPAISGLLSVLAALLGRDVRVAGRGLDRLGLGDFVRREIDELLRDGWLSALWRRALAD